MNDRLKFSIGTAMGSADGEFHGPACLAFDHLRGLLFVVDAFNHRVQVFSCDDGSFVNKFGQRGYDSGHFQYPFGIAIDHDHDRILVTSTQHGKVLPWSLRDYSPCIDEQHSNRFVHKYPQALAIDTHHKRIFVADFTKHRVHALSSIDLSFLFSIGGNEGSRPGEFNYPTGIAIDHDRHRIIVTDTINHRVQVLSLIDGSFLFEFGSQGDQPGQFSHPRAVCMANQGRIIVADCYNRRLQAFTHEGHHISSFDCNAFHQPWGVAFDEHRGLIAFSVYHQVHVIGANQWLPDTEFTWRPDLHRYAPSWMKRAVSTMTMIRSLVDESAMSMIPNELLFEIFAYL